MKTARLSSAQLKVMEVLWKLKRATAREITDAMNEVRFTAHSTVQTLLRRLEKKGVVAHEKIDRTFYFFPVVEKENVKKNSIRDLIDSMFNGEPDSLVAYLIRNEKLPPEKLDEIRGMLNNKKKESG